GGPAGERACRGCLRCLPRAGSSRGAPFPATAGPAQARRKAGTRCSVRWAETCLPNSAAGTTAAPDRRPCTLGVPDGPRATPPPASMPPPSAGWMQDAMSEFSRWIDETFGDLRVKFFTDCAHGEHTFTVRREVLHDDQGAATWQHDPTAFNSS